MADNSFFEHIDDYLDGNLPPDKRRAFEQALKTDPQLAAEVQLERDTRSALHIMAKDEMKANMRRWYAEMEADGTAPALDDKIAERPGRFFKPRLSWRQVLIGGAMILVGYLVVWLTIFNGCERLFEVDKNQVLPPPDTTKQVADPQPPDGQQRQNEQENNGTLPQVGVSPVSNPFNTLVKAELEKYKALIVSENAPKSGSPDSIELVLNEAAAMLNQKQPKYPAVISKLEKIDYEHNRKGDVKRMLTLAYQKNRQPGKAIAAYKAYLAGRSGFLPDDDWYLLILYLENPQTYKKEILEQVKTIQSSPVAANKNRLEEIKPLLQKERLWVEPEKR